MNNNTLGIKIVRNHSGFTTLFEHNSNPILTNSVEDIRQLLESVNNLEENNVALMISSLDEGFIITMATWISGLRGDECISAWIFIPNHIKISGKEIVSVIDVTKKELLATQRNDAKLLEAFSYTYEVAPAKRYTSRYQGDKIAFRYYGQGTLYSLSDLLNDMGQAYYQKYKRIFLLDKSSNQRCSTGDDLSSNKVLSAILIPAPHAVDNFIPYIGKNPFNESIYVNEGDEINVEWKRSGFKSIIKTIKATKGVECQIPTRNEYMMIVDYEAIQVLDESSEKPIKDYNLRINNYNVLAGQRIEISIDVIAQSRVEIYADGYEEWSKVYDLRKANVIYLKKKRFAYQFVLLSKNHKEIHIEYHAKGFLKECPIEGYRPYKEKLDPYKDNWLEYKPFTKAIKITLSIIFAVVLLLGGIVGWYLTDYWYKKDISDYKKQISTLTYDLNNTQKNKPAEQRQESQQPESPNWEQVVEYLDKNTKWERSAMEKFVGIQGLWDAMNNGNSDKILEYETKLQSSEKFQKLLNVIKNKKYCIKNPPYCPLGDEVITIDSYIEKVTKKNTPPTNEEQQQLNNPQKNWT